MNIYYVYQYLREDNTPYYIGKGKNRRAWSKNHCIAVPDSSRIQIIKNNLTEDEAFQLEINLISQYGRKDLGTGILRNRTNGGDNFRDPTVEQKRLLSVRRTTEQLLKTGTHTFLDENHKTNTRKRQQNLAKQGKHNFTGLNEKRLEQGTHNFLTTPSPSTVKICCIKCKRETTLPGLGSHKKDTCPIGKTPTQQAYQAEYRRMLKAKSNK